MYINVLKQIKDLRREKKLKIEFHGRNKRNNI